MGSLNRDTIIASFMLIFWSIFLWASFDIRIVEYGTMEADVWPRGILVVLYVLTAIYLVQSLRAGPDAAPDEPFTVGGWLRKYRNPIWCFALYLLFLLTLDFFGMLFGGILLVFMLLNILGNHSPKDIAIHAAVAIISIGGMWSVFTFGLNVILPPSAFFEYF
jgi:putative tricarboxylic transport membrane protein